MSFLDKLVEYDTNRGVNLTFVILDNARIHRSHEVRNYIKKYEKRLFLIYQPTYSPQLNPQENMWNWMKKFLSSSKAFANMQDLSEKVSIFQKLVEDNFDLVKQRVQASNYYK
jgi:transposase